MATALSAADAAPIPLTTGRYRFPQGVASGDPRPDGVVLWTRVEAADLSQASIPVRVQIARGPDFVQVVLDEMLIATAAGDHTLRLVVQGLDADTIYFYRFLAAGDQSRLGARGRHRCRMSSGRRALPLRPARTSSRASMARGRA
jgi:phosphodiesterase/alkaline phosphatase D-like protein